MAATEQGARHSSREKSMASSLKDSLLPRRQSVPGSGNQSPDYGSYR